MNKLPVNWRKRIESRIEQLAKNPYARNNNAKKLRNSEFYRLRVGNYRVIYEINDKTVTVVIIAVKPRGKAYQ